MSEEGTFASDLEALRNSKEGRRVERRAAGAVLVLIILVLSLVGLWSDAMAKRVETLVPVVGTWLLPFIAALVGGSLFASAKENLAQIKKG